MAEEPTQQNETSSTSSVRSSLGSAGSTAINFIKNIPDNISIKLIFLIAFFTLFYTVIYNICIFFGIDIVILNMYMGWLSFILILFTFLSPKYGTIFKIREEP